MHTIGEISRMEAQFVRDGVDLRLLARRQRMVLWLFLGSAVGELLLFAPGASRLTAQGAVVEVMIMLSVRVAVIAGTVLVLRALRTNVMLLIALTVLMILPLVNLLVLLAENGRATKTLRKAGLRVGLMGVKDEEVVRLLGANRCRKCSYDLTGNLTGVCPECGVPIAAPMARGLAG